MPQLLSLLAGLLPLNLAIEPAEQLFGAPFEAVGRRQKIVEIRAERASPPVFSIAADAGLIEREDDGLLTQLVASPPDRGVNAPQR
jgi:hypothetical protein